LHSKDIVYRDLKPENLLVSHVDGYLKLADFGNSKQIKGKTYTLCGTPEYIAPEILTNKGHGLAVDWWSLGILIFEFLSGDVPFCSDDPLKLYQLVLKGKIKYPKSISGDAKSLIKHLLQVDVSKRYGNMFNKSNDIKNHPFLKGKVNFSNLYYKQEESPYIPVNTR